MNLLIWFLTWNMGSYVSLESDIRTQARMDSLLFADKNRNTVDSRYFELAYLE